MMQVLEMFVAVQNGRVVLKRISFSSSAAFFFFFTLFYIFLNKRFNISNLEQLVLFHLVCLSYLLMPLVIVNIRSGSHANVAFHSSLLSFTSP